MLKTEEIFATCGVVWMAALSNACVLYFFIFGVRLFSHLSFNPVFPRQDYIELILV
jgi:uncharacterized membrane protein